jgi:hypothetical protein
MRNLPRRRREPVVPWPMRLHSPDLDEARFNGRDVPHLTCAQMWAELRVLRSALARETFHRRRPRVVVDSHGRAIGHHDWIRRRIGALTRRLRTTP